MTDSEGKRKYTRKKPAEKTDKYAVKLKKSLDRPITSPEELARRKEERLKINKLNRDRSKRQERELAKKLLGDRTPQSGAGSTKGDVRVQFVDRPGHYLIEAKLSARRKSYAGKEVPSIAIQGKWFPKLKEDTKSMRSLFGILCIQYVSMPDSYVLIDTLDLAKIYQVNEVYPIIDWTEKNTVAVQLYRPQAQEYTKEHGICIFQLKYGTYYLMTLSKWQEIIEGV